MGFFKNLLDGGASEANKKNAATAAGLSSMLASQHGFGQSQLLKGLAGLDTSYQNQKAALAGYGQQAAKGIIESGTATQAKQKSSLAAKGMLNTSVGANLAQQAQAGTSSALASLGENLGLMHANVEQQHGAQKMAGLQSLANYAMGKVGMASQIAPQYQAGTGLLGGIGAGLGQIAGGALGGLFSGGGGGGGSPDSLKAGMSIANMGYGKPSYTPGSFPNL